MQNAPSVVYPVGHSALYRRLLAGLGSMGAMALAYGWLTSVNDSPANTLHLRWALGLGLCGIWMGFAVRALQRSEHGSLKWDALAPVSNAEERPGAWFWSRGRARPVLLSVAPEWVYDGQHWVLLRLQGSDGRRRWIWLERRHDPSRWDDFRRALVSTS